MPAAASPNPAAQPKWVTMNGHSSCDPNEPRLMPM